MTEEQIPAWAASIAENADYLVGRIADLETALGDINQQLQTIGDVDAYGHPR